MEKMTFQGLFWADKFNREYLYQIIFTETQVTASLSTSSPKDCFVIDINVKQ